MKRTRQQIPWNVVTQDLAPPDERLLRRLRRSVARLERHLNTLPADGVHLHVALARQSRRPRYDANLALRLPDTLVQVRRTGAAPEEACDRAVLELVRKLGARDGARRPERTGSARPTPRTEGFTAAPDTAGAGPQSIADVARELAARHHARLLRHVRRLLWHETMAGELPERAIDARGVVDAAIEHALAAPERCPPRLPFALWLYALARSELARRRRLWLEEARSSVSLATVSTPEPDDDEAAGYDAEQPLDIIERQSFPPVTELGDITADPAVPDPRETAVRRDLLAGVRRVVSRWPRPQRELFEQHFVEGFESREISRISGRPEKQVRQELEKILQRLRDEVRDQAML